MPKLQDLKIKYAKKKKKGRIQLKYRLQKEQIGRIILSKFILIF